MECDGWTTTANRVHRRCELWVLGRRWRNSLQRRWQADPTSTGRGRHAPQCPGTGFGIRRAEPQWSVLPARREGVSVYEQWQDPWGDLFRHARWQGSSPPIRQHLWSERLRCKSFWWRISRLHRAVPTLGAALQSGNG